MKLRLYRIVLLCLTALSLFCSLAHSAPALPTCVVDDLQRKVCISKPVQRIISLSPGTTELIFSAGGGAKLIAVDSHSDYPEAVNSIHRIGGYPNVNAEAIVAMNPDLVVAWPGGNDSKLTQQLEKLGVTIFHSDPIDYEDIANVIRRFGMLFNTESKAEAAATTFLKRYQSLKSQYASSAPVRVFFEIWNAPLMTVNGQQIISKAIELCGGVNVFSEVPVRVPTVGIESVLAANPQAIVSSRIVRGGSSIEERWKPWDKIDAVKNNHLFALEGDLIVRPTARVLDGAEVLCRQLQSVRNQEADQE